MSYVIDRPQIGPPPPLNSILYAFEQGLDRVAVQRLLNGQFTRADYAQYLRTEHWQAKKGEALEFWGRACVLCDSPLALQIHHRPNGYKNLFREDPKWHLTVTCSRCHKRHHRR